MKSYLLRKGIRQKKTQPFPLLNTESLPSYQKTTVFPLILEPSDLPGAKPPASFR